MLKKYPFIRQEYLKDCGAACLFMIIKYYKGYVSMYKLNEMLKTTRKGVTAYHMVKTLKEVGFNAYGVRESKLRPTKVPFISNLIIGNSYKHFVVVYEVTDSYVLAADPASGIKKIGHDEFYKMWTGVNIMMYPEKSIVKMQNNWDFKLLKDMFSFDKKILCLIAFLSFVMTISGIIGSFFFQVVIENIDNENNLKYIFLIFIILALIKVLSDFYRNKCLVSLTNNIGAGITKKTFKHIIRLPYLYYHNHTTGEVTSKINDLNQISFTFNKVLVTLFIDLPLTLFSGILLFCINKLLFSIILVLVLFYILIILFTHKKINASIENTLRNKAEINSYMVESVGAFETIKGIGFENNIISKLNKKYDLFLKDCINLDSLINKQTLFKNIVSNFGVFIVMLIGIIMIKEGKISVYMFITYNILMSLFLEPIRNMVDLDFEIKETINTIKRVFGLFESVQDKNRECVQNIKLSNVSFSFDDVNYVLKNINLKINKGEKILISGESGSGKSTLLKLIKGYYSDYDGQAFINNKPIRNVNDSIVYISQKEKLFTGSIYENMTLGGSKDFDHIKQICLTDEFVSKYDLGYHTLLEEDGFNLSGGQRQRIALARGLQNFSTLIIDEGFSGLDTNLERKIIKNLFSYYCDKTIIVISHRLNNLDLFDRFIKLEDGMITLDETKAKEEIVY